MRNFAIGIGVVVALVFGAKLAFERWDTGTRPVKVAEQRVMSMLKNLAERHKDKNLMSEQSAIYFWAENRVVLDKNKLEGYEDLWLEFIKASGLTTATDWTISSTQVHPAADNEPIWVEVAVTSGNKTVVLKVPDEATPIVLLEGSK